jgi:hypothetical protein
MVHLLGIQYVINSSCSQYHRWLGHWFPDGNGPSKQLSGYWSIVKPLFQYSGVNFANDFFSPRNVRMPASSVACNKVEKPFTAENYTAKSGRVTYERYDVKQTIVI